MRVSALLLLAVALASIGPAAQQRTPARTISWNDVTPAHARLTAAGISSATFDAYIKRIKATNERRVREGDLDHLIFYLLQSTAFTKLQPIEPALSAKSYADTGEISVRVTERAKALLGAVDRGGGDQRLAYFRELVRSVFTDVETREAALLREYARVMKFVYEKEFVAQKSERRQAAVAELYRTRGLSTDTAVEAGFLVSEGLGVLRALDPALRIRRVLIVGPGLDLAPRTGFADVRPPESYQPWAVIDALLALGLSRLDDLEVRAADINPRVVRHLTRSRNRPPELTFINEIAETDAVSLSPEFRQYVSALGSELGSPSATRTGKAIRVRADVARVLKAETLDIVTQRLTDASFDLVIATNILPYFDDTELTLALTNIASMLAPRGIFLHNEARPILQELSAVLGIPLEQARSAVVANVRGGAPLVDSVFLHRKTGLAGLGFSFTNVAPQAGLTARTVYGAQGTNKYLIETTGTGVAAIDYDNDGWMDIFVVNGTTLDGFPKGREPISHLYRNRRDGTFEDVTARAGVGSSGWGQGACVGDFDADGRDDLFVTYWGHNRLYRNAGDGTFQEVAARAGLQQDRVRWGAGCAFLDYDRDGRLDLFVANYIDFDPASTPLPESGLCRYKGLPVACGPSGLPGTTNSLYRNNGNATFTDVSHPSGVAKASGTYALGVSTIDFDDDGWTDLYVANDSTPSALYRNNRDGTFTDVAIAAGCAFNQDGRPQAGMGVAVGDYDRNGTMDIFKTNFAGDTSTLYANTGKGTCEDRTFAGGIGVNTRWLGWGAGFLDLDLDGWLDLFLVNGHVYPEVDRLKSEAGYRQPKVVYRNLRNGRFSDVTAALGPPATTAKAGRGAAFADFDNDGDVDIVVNNIHDTPDLFRLDHAGQRKWITLKLVGTRSNRNAIGALARVITSEGEQRQEVRGGGSYYSQNDFRLHFGLGDASVERVVVRWPNGAEATWTTLAANRVHTLTEGAPRH